MLEEFLKQSVEYSGILWAWAGIFLSIGFLIWITNKIDKEDDKQTVRIVEKFTEDHQLYYECQALYGKSWRIMTKKYTVLEDGSIYSSPAYFKNFSDAVNFLNYEDSTRFNLEGKEVYKTVIHKSKMYKRIWEKERR